MGMISVEEGTMQDWVNEWQFADQPDEITRIAFRN